MLLGFQFRERVSKIKQLVQLLQSCYNMSENIFLQALVLFTDVQVCIPTYFTSTEQLFGLLANLKNILINIIVTFLF